MCLVHTPCASVGSKGHEYVNRGSVRSMCIVYILVCVYTVHIAMWTRYSGYGLGTLDMQRCIGANRVYSVSYCGLLMAIVALSV